MFGKRLKELRESNGYSMDKLIELYNTKFNGKMNKSTLSRYENGLQEPMYTTVLNLAKLFNVSVEFLTSIETSPSNTIFLDDKKIHMIPLFETVSAGFGTYAANEIIGYMPCYLSTDAEASETLYIKVSGDSMYPKIEDGDIIQVHKQSSVDSGSIAVILLDKTEGLVKKVIYGEDWIELHSINPMYPVQRFSGEQVTRLEILGLVKRITKDV